MSARLRRAQDANLHALVTVGINQPDRKIALLGRSLQVDVQGDIALVSHQLGMALLG